MRTFVLGDVHGTARAVRQCFERSGFNKETDRLILLGDICDGFSEVYQCVEEFLPIRNLVFVRGNHDDPFIEFLETGHHPWDWSQGGPGTAKSYAREVDYRHVGLAIRQTYSKGDIVITDLLPEDVPVSHHEFFKKSVPFFVDEKHRLYVHGGFDRKEPIISQAPYTLMWDRDLWKKAMCVSDPGGKLKTFDGYETIFLGHTSTQFWDSDKPLKRGGIWNLDQGAGWSGKLTLMNADTEEYFQSDCVLDLYPDEKGRRR